MAADALVPGEGSLRLGRRFGPKVRAWLAPGVTLAGAIAVDGDADHLLTRADCRMIKMQRKVIVGRVPMPGGALYVKRYNVFSWRVALASLAQASFGLQVGGHTYRELIVFENKAALDRFRENRLDFTADAEAFLADNGAAANAQFIDGIVVVVTPLAGAIAQAAIGGQQITYVPK